MPRVSGSPAPANHASRGSKNRLGRYLVTGRLGRGGMGVVYEAHDTLLKRQVAIKLLPKDVSANPEALKRFLREGQGAARLNHPNVVAVYDIGESDGTYFIVMELVKGGSAQDFLLTNRRFPWAEATRILVDVCRGVIAAHRAGLIHRDIKPANILRSPEGVVKLGDFGLVKPAGRQGTVVTALGAVLGTPHYMSPEQVQSGRVDERSDIYSLGATYYALLTGRPPYPGSDSMQVMLAHSSKPIPDPRTSNADIPVRCSEIIRKAMAKDRAQRYADAETLLADLECHLKEQGETLASGPPGAPSASGVPTVWCKADTIESSDRLSIAEVYPGERTEPVIPAVARPRKTVALGLGALVLALALVVLPFVRRSGPSVVPKIDPKLAPPAKVLEEKDDWPSLAVAAENAIRERQLPEIRRVLKKLQVLERRQGPGDAALQSAMALAMARLEKAAAFRERITEQGLILSTSGWVSGVAFSPDDHWLAVGNSTADGGVLVWDSWTGEKHVTLGPRRNNQSVNVQAVAISHDSKFLAAACSDDVGVKLWQIDTGVERPLPLAKNVNRVLTLAFSPSSRKLVAGMEPFGVGLGKPYLKIWNTDTGGDSFAFKSEHRDMVTSVAFSAGGQQIATGSRDKRVVLWNSETGRIWREFRAGFPVDAIACSPRGGTLAAAGMEQGTPMVRLWDDAGERLIDSRPLPHGVCRCLAFSPDGLLLAAGSGTRVVLRDVATHAIVATLHGHSQEVATLAFSARGGILATGSSDQTMRLWDVSRFLPPRPAP